YPYPYLYQIIYFIFFYLVSLLSSSQLLSFFHIYDFFLQKEEKKPEKEKMEQKHRLQATIVFSFFTFFPKLEPSYLFRITQRVQMDKIKPYLIYLLSVDAIRVEIDDG
ncbi:hypothetical protein LINGRAHAP2_LOCUS2493, partial [Linum grandiflorum]